MNRILILGEAKTGTTALYHKLQDAMPSYTRCVFEPGEDELRDLSRANTKLPLLVKAIFNRKIDFSTINRFDKQIFILRDPRDRLVSGLLYSAFQRSKIDADQTLLDPDNLDALVRQLLAKQSSPDRFSLFDIFGLSLAGWCHSTRANHRAVMETLDKDDFFNFKYEDMVDGNLQSLEQYLGFRLDKQTKVIAAHERVSRSKGYGNWRHYFTAGELASIRPNTQDYVSTFDYSTDWSLADPQIIRPEECSEYVRKLVKLTVRDLKNELWLLRNPTAPTSIGLSLWRKMTERIDRVYRRRAA